MDSGPNNKYMFSKRLTKIYLPIFSACFFVFLLVYALFKVASELPSAADILRLWERGHWGVLGYLFAFFIANLLRSQRWYLLVREHVEMTRMQAWNDYQWLFAVKSLTPFKSGEVVRALWLRTRGGRTTYGVGVFFIERIADLCVLSLFGILVLFSLARDDWLTSSMLFFVGCSICVFVLLFYSGLYGRVLSFFIEICSNNKWLKGGVRGRLEVLQTCLADDVGFTRRISVFFLTVIIWVVIVAGVCLVFSDLNLLKHWTVPLGFIFATNFSGIISPFPANVGSYQLAGAGILSFYGIPVTDAIGVAIFVHALMLIQVIVLGIICFIISMNSDGYKAIYRILNK